MTEFGADCRAKLLSDMAQIERCTGLLSDDDGWSRVNERCNSVANLLIHLRGNITQWMIGGVAERAVERDRPAEFAARVGPPLGRLTAELRSAVEESVRILAGISNPEWARMRSIQGYTLSVLSAVLHVVEHFSYHTGQIVHMTKAIKDVDLSRFDERGQRVGGAATAAAGPKKPW